MIAVWLFAGWLVGCGGSALEAPSALLDAEPERAKDAKKEEARPPAPAPAGAVGKGASLGSVGGLKADVAIAGAPPEAPAPDLREWFPEAMLWAPEVITDAEGRAVVPFTVPDSLTGWRLLAHAHTADGALGGATARVVSALPAWVDVLTPRQLTAGDRLEANVLVVGIEPIDALVVVEASGAAAARSAARVSLAAGERRVSPTSIAVGGPGELVLRATLEGADAVERRVQVRPAGRPVRAERGGVIADRVGWTAADWPGRLAGSGAMEVWMLPGGLGVLRQELARLSDPSGAWPGAYGWMVSGDLTRLGVEPDAAKRLRMRAWQRLVRGVGVDALGAAVVLLHLDAGDDELRAMYRDALATAQRGDGTWAFERDGTLQQVMLDTALGALAMAQDQDVTRELAADAIGRMLPRLDDPLSAAAALASGLLDPTAEAAALARVQAALREQPDGAARVELPRGVLGPDGAEVSPTAALAWVALALQGRDDAAWRRVVGSLVAGYRPGVGLGAGVMDGPALRQILAALPPVDRDVTVRLRADGVEVAHTTLSAVDPGAPGRLAARASGATWELTVEPPVPGLVWAATESASVAWSDERPPGGASLTIEVPPARVGEVARVSVTLEAPAAATGVVAVGLPPGAVLADAPAGLRQVGDTVELAIERADQGAARRYEIPVRPGFAGALQSAPHRIVLSGAEALLPPSRWEIRPAGGG